MSSKFPFLIAASLCAFVSNLTAIAAPPDSVNSITGHGTWVLDTGDVYPNHQPYLESTSVDAWLDADGTAHGTVVWMDTFNGPNDDHGPGVSGYTWQIDVDTYFTWDIPDFAYVEGVVTHSNVKDDIGFRTGFYFFDGGPGGTDYVWGNPVLAGNLLIR